MAPKTWPKARRVPSQAPVVAQARVAPQLVPAIPSQAAVAFRESAVFLQRWALEKYALGRWSASEVTTLAWHLERMGASIVPGLAVQPSAVAPFQHASRAIMKSLGLQSVEDQWYTAAIPVHDAVSNTRTFKEIPFCLPHMVLACEVQSGTVLAGPPSVRDTPNFKNHTVTTSYGEESTVPMGLFIDGTDWSHEGSLTAWYFNISGKPDRHVAAIVDKAQFCHCGCSGLCTLQAVDRVLSWSFNHAANGRHPRVDHNGDNFKPDSVYAAKAGEAIGKHGALVHFRGDLVGAWEYLGFRRWNTWRPCFLCNCSRDNMMQFHKRPWQDATPALYSNEIAGRIRVVVADQAQVEAVFAALSPGWHDGGRHDGGRILLRDVAPLGLAKGDALVVCGDVRDLHMTGEQLLQITPRPRLTFFRSAGAPVKFVSPLMGVMGAGLGMVCIDRMHSLDLGAVSAFNGVAIRRLLQADVFQQGSTEEGMERGMAELSKLYRRWAREPTNRSKTWLKCLKAKNLGPVKKPFLKFRTSGASKNRCVLPFVVKLLAIYKTALDRIGKHGSLLHLCGCAFLRVYSLLRLATRKALNENQCRNLRRFMLVALRSWMRAKGHAYPKNHMCWHLVCNASSQGGAQTATDEDESFNKVVKHIYHSAALGSIRVLTKLWLYHNVHKLVR